jgi:hypothetical protein
MPLSAVKETRIVAEVRNNVRTWVQHVESQQLTKQLGHTRDFRQAGLSLSLFRSLCRRDIAKALHPPGHKTDQRCSVCTDDARCHGFTDCRQSNVLLTGGNHTPVHRTTFQTAGKSPNGNMWRSKRCVLMPSAINIHYGSIPHYTNIHTESGIQHHLGKT